VFRPPHNMAPPPPPPPKGGLSLYANLLDPKADSQATVSGAPVVYDSGKKDNTAAKKELNQGEHLSHTPPLPGRPWSAALSIPSPKLNPSPSLSSQPCDSSQYVDLRYLRRKRPNQPSPRPYHRHPQAKTLRK
jgi:hypothetical protein